MSEVENRYSKPIVAEVAIERRNNIRTKSKLKRWLFAFLGSIALALAVLGVFVPGIPCTPLALLAAALFAKSSDRLYQWLLNSKVLGSRIKNYHKRKGLTKKEKINIILLMWTMVLISSLIIIKVLTIRVVILVGGFIGMLVVWFVVPNSRQSKD